MALTGMRRRLVPLLAAGIVLCGAPARAAYLNFESSQVHPIGLTPSGQRLLVVNTPDGTLEVFGVGPTGTLTRQAVVLVGLEPVSVRALSETSAWVVNHLSDTISVVDLTQATVTRTLFTGDEPNDVAFAGGRAFVAVGGEDAVKVFNLADLSLPPQSVVLFGEKPRALAVSPSGAHVYAVVQDSGNQTAVVNANVIAANNSGLDTARLTALGLNNIICNGAPPPYPPLPAGISRNPALTDPAPPAQPPVSLIVKWDRAAGRWKDEAGQDWTHCLPFRLPDLDLFVINTAGTPGVVSQVDHLGTTLFEVSVNPATGRIWIPNTEARNQVRFEHPKGVQGHMVDNRFSVVDPGAGFAVTTIDLNTHIDRASSPASNLAEREASLSQPGMMAWNGAGTRAWLTAIGSRKLWRVDGACASGPCIFGSARATPDAVEVGEGPTGVALHEASNRVFVLNRFSNSIAVVDASSMTKLADVPLHDPSSATVRQGRRLLYDGAISSAHGDAACSSCHISGDRDGLAWDLGDPEGSFAPYGSPDDNVRFVVPFGGSPLDCPPGLCAAHDGFDPQKGPMTTQTLRAMLEPLHWRGDRGTMNDFNQAFPGLMGAEDIGPINGKPAGLSAAEMELYRQFALGISFPPNPFRNVNDTLPNAPVTIPGIPFAGNPAAGETVFNTGRADANQPCAACHQLPFGTAGGKIGGVEPGDPPTAPAALFNGDADESPHSDLKIPHLRNMYEKIGPRFGSHTNPADPPAGQKSGFGFIHDGAIPDMQTFLSASVFTVTAPQVRDLTMFMMHFPTGTRPSVGRNVTVPQGTPPTGTAAQEQLLSTLISLGNAADVNGHCDLVASARDGSAPRSWYLNGSLWTADAAGALQVSTAALRTTASGPITFLCVPRGSGARMGTDRDEDGKLNSDDCAPADAGSTGPATEVSGLQVDTLAASLLEWDSQSATAGPGVTYEVVSGEIGGLRSVGLAAATSCLLGDLTSPSANDPQGDPAPGSGWYYLVRSRNGCNAGTFGPGRGSLEPLDCSGF